jgi:hypothetical protein
MLRPVHLARSLKPGFASRTCDPIRFLKRLGKWRARREPDEISVGAGLVSPFCQPDHSFRFAFRRDSRMVPNKSSAIRSARRRLSVDFP